jgi:hypothetical protein
MLTGRKSGPAEPPSAIRPRPALAFWLCLGGLTLTSGAVLALSYLPPLGTPTARPDPAYVRECGACHLAYSPSLLPAASWTTLMAHLDHHFGEDASLEPALTTRLHAWLLANAAEHWDTLAAVRIRESIDPADPMRITASLFWRRMHRRIPEATFANKEVGSRGACDACHTDASSGRFAPQSIEIPEDLQ